MRNETKFSKRSVVVLPTFTLLAAGVGTWSCTAEFEVECPAGTSQTAGGGDVNEACTPVAGGAGGAGGAVSSGGASGGGQAAGQGGAPTGSGGAGDGGSAGGVGLGGGGAGGAAGGPTAFVRFAHLSPDAPAFDVCLSPTGAFDEAPVLQAAGLASGLTYQKVSAYLPVKAGRTLMRLVAAGSSQCSQGLPGITETTFEKLAEGTFYTIGAMGKVTPAAGQRVFKVLSYEDKDPGVDTGNDLHHRVINTIDDLSEVNIYTSLGRRPKEEDAGGMSFGEVSTGRPNNKGYIALGLDEPNAWRNPIQYYIKSPYVNSGETLFMAVVAPTGPSGDPPTQFLTTSFIVGEVKTTPRTDNVLLCDDASAALPEALVTSCSLVGIPKPIP